VRFDSLCGPRGCRRRTAPSAGWPRSNALSSSRWLALVDTQLLDGQEFCDAAWRRGLAFSCEGRGGGRLGLAPVRGPVPVAADAGCYALLPRSGGRGRRPGHRATDRVLKQRRDLYFAFRRLQRLRLVHARIAPRLRASGPAAAPVHTRGVDARPARAPPGPRLQPGARGRSCGAVAPGRDWSGVKRLVFDESDGFWLAPEDPAGRPAAGACAGQPGAACYGGSCARGKGLDFPDPSEPYFSCRVR